MGIAAGNLRERIELLGASCSTLPNGEVVETFKVYASVRAQVIQQRSSKALTNGENWYPAVRSFRFRMPPAARGGDRIRYNGEVYVALPPKVYPRDGMQEVDCELLQNQE